MVLKLPKRAKKTLSGLAIFGALYAIDIQGVFAQTNLEVPTTSPNTPDGLSALTLSQIRSLSDEKIKQELEKYLLPASFSGKETVSIDDFFANISSKINQLTHPQLGDFAYNTPDRPQIPANTHPFVQLILQKDIKIVDSENFFGLTQLLLGDVHELSYTHASIVYLLAQEYTTNKLTAEQCKMIFEADRHENRGIETIHDYLEIVTTHTILLENTNMEKLLSLLQLNDIPELLQSNYYMNTHEETGISQEALNNAHELRSIYDIKSIFQEYASEIICKILFTDDATGKINRFEAICSSRIFEDYKADPDVSKFSPYGSYTLYNNTLVITNSDIPNDVLFEQLHTINENIDESTRRENTQKIYAKLAEVIEKKILTNATSEIFEVERRRDINITNYDWLFHLGEKELQLYDIPLSKKERIASLQKFSPIVRQDFVYNIAIPRSYLKNIPTHDREYMRDDLELPGLQSEFIQSIVSQLIAEKVDNKNIEESIELLNLIDESILGFIGQDSYNRNWKYSFMSDIFSHSPQRLELFLKNTTILANHIHTHQQDLSSNKKALGLFYVSQLEYDLDESTLTKLLLQIQHNELYIANLIMTRKINGSSLLDIDIQESLSYFYTTFGILPQSTDPLAIESFVKKYQQFEEHIIQHTHNKDVRSFFNGISKTDSIPEAYKKDVESFILNLNHHELSFFLETYDFYKPIFTIYYKPFFEEITKSKLIVESKNNNAFLGNYTLADSDNEDTILQKIRTIVQKHTSNPQNGKIFERLLSYGLATHYPSSINKRINSKKLAAQIYGQKIGNKWVFVDEFNAGGNYACDQTSYTIASIIEENSGIQGGFTHCPGSEFYGNITQETKEKILQDYATYLAETIKRTYNAQPQNHTFLLTGFGVFSDLKYNSTGSFLRDDENDMQNPDYNRTDFGIKDISGLQSRYDALIKQAFGQEVIGSIIQKNGEIGLQYMLKSGHTICIFVYKLPVDVEIGSSSGYNNIVGDGINSLLTTSLKSIVPTVILGMGDSGHFDTFEIEGRKQLGIINPDSPAIGPGKLNSLEVIRK